MNNNSYTDSFNKKSELLEFERNVAPRLFKTFLEPNEFLNKKVDTTSETDGELKKEQEYYDKIVKTYTNSFTGLKKSLEINGWNTQKTEIIKTWKKQLDYRYIVNYYFMYFLKQREASWSWSLIILSSISSVLTIVEVTNPLVEYSITYFLTALAFATTLIAAYMKKQNYVERIKEMDRYTQRVGKTSTELNNILDYKPWNRPPYDQFKDKHLNDINDIFSFPPPISPIEFKITVYNLTRHYPELISNMWPWFEERDNGEFKYFHMTDWGKHILVSYRKYRYGKLARIFLYLLYCKCFCFICGCSRNRLLNDDNLFAYPDDHNTYKRYKIIQNLYNEKQDKNSAYDINNQRPRNNNDASEYTNHIISNNNEGFRFMNFMRTHKPPTNRRRSTIISKGDYLDRDDNIYGNELKEIRPARRKINRQATVNHIAPRLNIDNISQNIKNEIIDIKNDVVEEKTYVIEKKNNISKKKNDVFKKPPKVIEEKNKITDISNNVNDISGN